MEPKAPLADCSNCPLRDQPFVPSHGSWNADALIVVGEAPGQKEVELGRPFVGPSGKLLDSCLSELGRDPESTFRTNVVLCRPPDNREPTFDEIRCCLPRLLNELQMHPSPTVVTMGKTASDTLIPSHSRGAWMKAHDKDILPTWHPAYVLRKPSEATSLLRDLRVALNGYQEPRFSTPPRVEMPSTLSELRALLASCPSGSRVSFDIETDQVVWYDRQLGGITIPADAILMLGIAWSKEWGLVVSDEMLYDTPGVCEALQEFALRADVTFAAQNGKFDMVFMRARLGLKFRVDFDTMLAAYILDENGPLGLKEVAKEEFGLADYEVAIIKQYLTTKNDRYSKIPQDKLALYLCWDLVVTRELSFVFEQRLKDAGLWEWPYMKVIIPAQTMLTDQELIGIQVDIPYLIDAGHKLEVRAEEIANECREIVEQPGLNLNSPIQVAAVLFDQLHLPPSKSRRYKERSTQEDAITHLKGKHPFVDKLLYYRGIAKLKSSYIDNMLSFADARGRVHPSIKIHGTEIGRMSAVNPAAMTIPRPGDKTKKDYDPYTDGAMIRGAIIARPGYILVVSDYSQAELRVAAVLAHEQFLLDVYANNRDLHTEVAIAMYGPNYTKEQRVLCKMFNFSYLYGGSEYSFAMDSGLSVAVAKDFVHKYNTVMPALLAYRKSQFALLCAQGYVSTIFGRRRRFPFITQENLDDAKKACVHAPIAGTASDLTLLSGIETQRMGYDVILEVHDSLVVEVPEDDGERVGPIVADVMRSMGERYLPEVKWKADYDVVQRWSEPPELLWRKDDTTRTESTPASTSSQKM